MPNWCNNFLRIAVPTDPAFRAYFRGFCSADHKPSGMILPFSFEKIVPMPESEANNWYEWRIQNWGTKWDLVPQDCHTWSTTKSIWYNFQTAWGPPIEVIKVLSKNFPTNFMRLEFEEKGLNMSGNLRFQAGFMLSHSTARCNGKPMQLV